jgi:ABC-type Na+ efflux pump permease subunit
MWGRPLENKMIGPTLAIARNTFTELVRQKVFFFLLIFALLIIGNSAFMAKFSFQEQFQMLKDISLGAMSVFTSLIAILATANFLPKDMEDRTIYTLLAKPVPRYRYLLGKLLGIIALLACATLLMSALFLATLWLRESAVLMETRSQLSGAPGEEMRLATKEITDATFNINLLPGIVIIFIKSSLLASLTLFLSSFATSSIFTIIMAAALYFIGHLQATAREFWLSGVEVEWWSRLLAAGVALLFPDLQAFNLTDDIIAGTAVPLALFLNTAGLGILYIAVYSALAALVFSGREL